MKKKMYHLLRRTSIMRITFRKKEGKDHSWSRQKEREDEKGEGEGRRRQRGGV